MDSPFNTLLFDLDDTLYLSNVGISQAVKKNIDDFLIEKCGFPESKATSLRVEFFKTYGSTLAGLRALGYDIDADDYHGFVHGRLPYDVIKPDPQLRNLLRSITQRKIIFTNSDRVHAIKCLKRLGLEDCFDQIICFETLNPNLPNSTRPDEFPVVLKPSVDAMKIALEASKVDPRRTLFFDDNVRNIAAGKAMGLWTCLVGGKTVKTKEADYAMETVNNLAQVIPEIWVNQTEGGDERISRSRSRSELDAMLAAATPVGA
ncbi:HAD-superfamily hydrolase, subfamily IA, variant 3 [Corchorus capsularis]|uniref:HAD-superfamily hydrolase, subfamily IA, variant 3 n=1 Tax=Corchorus capsularis TaxID=210143 RepID=A0A1R3GT20_COCAP|nr:HAD-superfamily hydrolase, subfamily IA, variant 3 [Corchorus capsularis]